MLQRVALCCSVQQCDAMRCSCSVLQCVAVRFVTCLIHRFNRTRHVSCGAVLAPVDLEQSNVGCDNFVHVTLRIHVSDLTPTHV